MVAVVFSGGKGKGSKKGPSWEGECIWEWEWECECEWEE